MRIIAGEHRGRKLVGPPPEGATRPVTDRVKQAMFDRLMAQGRVTDEVVLDLFSGTGSMGLECLSRGAKHVTFVERDRDARKRLEENIVMLKVGDRATVLGADALGMSLMTAVTGKWGPIGLVFMDPPYAMMKGEERGKVEGQMTRLSAAGVVEDGGCLVLRVEKGVEAGVVEGWGEPTVYGYGSMSVVFYVKPPAPEVKI